MYDGKTRCLGEGSGFLALGIKKKRGRKEVFLIGKARLTASASFLDLS